MPCVESPGVVYNWSLDIVVPEGHTAVASGCLVKKKLLKKMPKGFTGGLQGHGGVHDGGVHGGGVHGGGGHHHHGTYVGQSASGQRWVMYQYVLQFAVPAAAVGFATGMGGTCVGGACMGGTCMWENVYVGKRVCGKCGIV